MTEQQINKLKMMIKGLNADLRNIQTDDYEALDSMRRTFNVMSEIVCEMELELERDAIAA